jgi:hypothetical protein
MTLLLQGNRLIYCNSCFSEESIPDAILLVNISEKWGIWLDMPGYMFYNHRETLSKKK